MMRGVCNCTYKTTWDKSLTHAMTLFIHSQTSTVASLKFGMGKLFHPTLYNGCNYLSILGLKLNHVSKRGYWCQSWFSWTTVEVVIWMSDYISQGNYDHNCLSMPWYQTNRLYKHMKERPSGNGVYEINSIRYQGQVTPGRRRGNWFHKSVMYLTKQSLACWLMKHWRD